MFKDVPDNIVVCINKTNILNKIYDQIRNKTCYIEDCTDDWKLNQKNLLMEPTNVIIIVQIRILMNIMVDVIQNVEVDIFIMRIILQNVNAN